MDKITKHHRKIIIDLVGWGCSRCFAIIFIVWHYYTADWTWRSSVRVHLLYICVLNSAFPLLSLIAKHIVALLWFTSSTFWYSKSELFEKRIQINCKDKNNSQYCLFTHGRSTVFGTLLAEPLFILLTLLEGRIMPVSILEIRKQRLWEIKELIWEPLVPWVCL